MTDVPDSQDFLDPDYVPRLGETINGPSVPMIVEAVKKRQANFPDEPLEMTLPLILMNIGKRFQPLRCEGKEWKGIRRDIPPGTGEPTCPNGHAIVKERGITLGWVMDRE